MVFNSKEVEVVYNIKMNVYLIMHLTAFHTHVIYFYLVVGGKRKDLIKKRNFLLVIHKALSPLRRNVTLPL